MMAKKYTTLTMRSTFSQFECIIPNLGNMNSMQVKNPILFGLIAILLIGGSILPAMAQVELDDSMIVINEVEFNPTGSDAGLGNNESGISSKTTNGLSGAQEYVELYNPSLQDIDISGWTITPSATWKTYTIPDNTVINAKSFAVFTHVNYWFKDFGDNVTLYNDAGNLIDETPTLEDKLDDSTSWQRIFDGLDTDSIDDWTQKRITPISSNGQVIQEDETSFTLIASVDSSEKIFGDTVTISGSVSERLYHKQLFTPQYIEISVNGPSYFKNIVLYPDRNLEFSTQLNLQKILGFKEGNYKVEVIYGDYTNATNFSLGNLTASIEETVLEQLSIYTDKESYIPGENVIFSASVESLIEYGGLNYSVKNPDGKEIFSGTIFENKRSTLHSDGYAFETQLFMSTVKPVYGLYTIEGEYEFVGTGVGATNILFAQTSFELTEDVKEDKPISLWTDKESYEIGETIKITGRSNQIWTEDIELQIIQTGIVGNIASDSYRASSPLDEKHSIKLNGDGTFAYDFTIQDRSDTNLVYGDYLIKVSEYFGESFKIITVVEDATEFVDERTSLGLKINKSVYYLGEKISISGHILNFVPNVRDNMHNIIQMTFLDSTGKALQYIDHKNIGSHGTNCNLNDCSKYSKPLIYTAIPDQIGNFRTDTILHLNQFDYGAYTIKAVYASSTVEETIRFQIQSATDSIVKTVEQKPIEMEVCKSTGTSSSRNILQDVRSGIVGILDCSTDNNFVVGDKLIVQGKVKFRNPTSLDQSSTNPSGSTQFGSSYHTDFTTSVNNYVLVSIPYPMSLVFTKASEFITVPNEGENYTGGGGSGGVGGTGNIDTTNCASDRLNCADRQTGYDGTAILKTQKLLLTDMNFKAYPDEEGNFSGLFDLRPGIFKSGSYALTTLYWGHQDEQIITITDNSLTGGEKPELIVITDKDEYQPGEIVQISGKIKNIYYFDSVNLSIQTPDISQVNCIEVTCDIGSYSQKLRTNEGIEGSTFSLNYKLGNDASAIGKYKITVDTYFANSEKLFFVTEESSIVKTIPTETPEYIVAKKIIEKFNRISDSNISIVLDDKQTQDSDLVPRVIQGSLFTSARGEESMVNIQVSTSDGTCIIGQNVSCMVSESTRKPGEIYEIVTIDDINYNVRYTGSDVRLEKFSILPESSGTQIDIKDWNVQVIKDDQPTRFYYKISYVNLE